MQTTRTNTQNLYENIAISRKEMEERLRKDPNIGKKSLIINFLKSLNVECDFDDPKAIQHALRNLPHEQQTLYNNYIKAYDTVIREDDEFTGKISTKKLSKIWRISPKVFPLLTGGYTLVNILESPFSEFLQNYFPSFGPLKLGQLIGNIVPNIALQELLITSLSTLSPETINKVMIGAGGLAVLTGYNLAKFLVVKAPKKLKKRIEKRKKLKQQQQKQKQSKNKTPDSIEI